MSRTFKKLCHNKYLKTISRKKDFVNRFKQCDLEENYSVRKINRIKSKKSKDLLEAFCVDYCYNKGNISKILHRILSNKTDLKDRDYFKNRNEINLLMKHSERHSYLREDSLFEEIEYLGWNIRIMRKNEPYVEYYYQTSSEKPRSKYELYKDLENLVFMKLDQMYSYGAHEYEISLYCGGGDSFAYEGSDVSWQINKLFLGNNSPVW